MDKSSGPMMDQLTQMVSLFREDLVPVNLVSLFTLMEQNTLLFTVAYLCNYILVVTNII